MLGEDLEPVFSLMSEFGIAGFSLSYSIRKFFGFIKVFYFPADIIHILSLKESRTTKL